MPLLQCNSKEVASHHPHLVPQTLSPIEFCPARKAQAHAHCVSEHRDDFLGQFEIEWPGDDFPLCRIKLVEWLYCMNTQPFPQIHSGMPLPHLADL